MGVENLSNPADEPDRPGSRRVRTSSVGRVEYRVVRLAGCPGRRVISRTLCDLMNIRVFRVTSWISLLCCIAMGAMWQRSARYQDRIQWTSTSASYRVGSVSGQLYLQQYKPIRKFSASGSTRKYMKITPLANSPTLGQISLWTYCRSLAYRPVATKDQT